jgi:hypothetical protein
MIYTIEVPSCGMLFLRNFIKIGTGIQTVLRFFLRKFKGYYVGITDGKELRSA